MRWRRPLGACAMMMRCTQAWLSVHGRMPSRASTLGAQSILTRRCLPACSALRLPLLERGFDLVGEEEVVGIFVAELLRFLSERIRIFVVTLSGEKLRLSPSVEPLLRHA